jgi:3-methyladenine DNA glycosylase AlkD
MRTSVHEPMTVEDVMDALRAVADPDRVPSMARVGIETSHALGVSVPDIRKVANRAGIDQALAASLWATEVHEARAVAILVADPEAISARVQRAWATDLDSWDLADMLADTLAATPGAHRTIATWSRARHGFTKRCAFAMIARMAVSSTEPDATFLEWLTLVRAEATDQRNEVKKAVNWALRQIGKRNRALHRAAIVEAEALAALDDPTARWIARDALRELRAPATVARFRR